MTVSVSCWVQTGLDITRMLSIKQKQEAKRLRKEKKEAKKAKKAAKKNAQHLVKKQDTHTHTPKYTHTCIHTNTHTYTHSHTNTPTYAHKHNSIHSHAHKCTVLLGSLLTVCVLPPLDQKGGPEHPEREDTEDEMEHKDVATVETGEHPDSSIPEAIVLDLSPVNFLDTVGVKTLRNVITEAVLLVTTRPVEMSLPLPLPLSLSPS